MLQEKRFLKADLRMESETLENLYVLVWVRSCKQPWLWKKGQEGRRPWSLFLWRISHFSIRFFFFFFFFQIPPKLLRGVFVLEDVTLFGVVCACLCVLMYSNSNAWNAVRQGRFILSYLMPRRLSGDSFHVSAQMWGKSRCNEIIPKLCTGTSKLLILFVICLLRPL